MEGGRGHTHLYQLGCRAELHVHGGVWVPPGDLEEPRGPCDSWASRTRISGGNFTSTEHTFPPLTLLASFSLPLLLFNLWLNFLKNGGRYCVKQCCKNEAQLLGPHFEKWPPTSFKPVVIPSTWREGETQEGEGRWFTGWTEEEHDSKKSQHILAKLTWLYLLYFFWEHQWMLYFFFNQGANAFIVKIIMNIIMSKNNVIMEKIQ